MILTVDIGNSTIGFGFCDKQEIRQVVAIEHMLDSELVCAKVENFLEQVAERSAPEGVVVCSVVPSALKCLQKMMKKAFGFRPKVVGRDIKVPIVNKYSEPRQVGKDRLVGAFAARELYGVPLVVIDLGTAITFDAVSVKGEYLGGAIIPGLRLSAEALHTKAALLPRATMKGPGQVIGRTTVTSIQSGLFHGYGALCDGMITRFTKEIGKKPRVVMTGGHATTMIRYMLSSVHKVDEHLVHKGLSLLSQ